MAFDATLRTTQEYLNQKAGFTGVLRTKQECLASLAARPNTANAVLGRQLLANSYAGVTGKTIQDALNNKVGQVKNALSTQEAARRL